MIKSARQSEYGISFKITAIVFFSLCLFITVNLHSDEKSKENTIKFEPELDPYYSSIDVTASLTSKPIRQLGKQDEVGIYKELLKKFYLPRELILETSINPLPYAATLIKKESLNFYQSAKINNSLNYIHAVTAGFEEPWAASLFLGNVVEFEPGNTIFYLPRKSFLGKRHGYSGFLASAGNFHIKDDVMVPDVWIETECKLKGEQFLEQSTLMWSFRFGSKLHQNSEITDVFYIGIKRDITNFNSSGNFFLTNSGFEYVFDFSQRDFSGIRHYFVVNKKLPLPKYRIAARFTLGIIWTSPQKYTGSLAAQTTGDVHPLQFIIQPNIIF